MRPIISSLPTTSRRRNRVSEMQSDHHSISADKTFLRGKVYFTPLLYRDKLIYGGWIPHLTFTFTITTTKFSVHQYRRTYSERKEVRNKVWELHNKGWGYTKIHKYLINNGYEIGKSRTTVDGMIKKMKKREYILGLQDQIRKYEDFKIEYFRV